MPVVVKGKTIYYELAIVKVWLLDLEVEEREFDALAYGLGFTSPEEPVSKKVLKTFIYYFLDDEDGDEFFRSFDYAIEHKIKSILSGKLDARLEGQEGLNKLSGLALLHGQTLEPLFDNLLLGLFGSQNQVHQVKQMYSSDNLAIIRGLSEDDYVDLVRAQHLAIKKIVKAKKFPSSAMLSRYCRLAGRCVSELSSLEHLERYGKVKKLSTLHKILHKMGVAVN